VQALAPLGKIRITEQEQPRDNEGVSRLVM
jgi:hypothetical protein